MMWISNFSGSLNGSSATAARANKLSHLKDSNAAEKSGAVQA